MVAITRTLMPKAKTSPKFDPRSWDQRIGESDAGAFADNIGKSFDEFDYAAIDSDAERLCETLSAAELQPEQAAIILRWHERETEIIIERTKATLMGGIVSGLIASQNVPLDIRALAFASGIGASVRLGNQAEVARDLGVSRAAVSKSANRWSDILGYRVTKFLRIEGTRASCAQAQGKAWKKRL